jgi:hypothetical protein
MNNVRKTSSLAAIALVCIPCATWAQDQNSFRERTYTRTVAGEWQGARLADGQPDVQGHWSNTIGNHNNLTDPNGGLPGEARRNGQQRPRSERAPSRVTDPSDGQFPFQPWARTKQEEFLANFHDPVKGEYVEPLARCAPAGPTKSFMWHGYEIRQFPGHVVFLFDSGTRVIYLTAKADLPESVKLWNGDSRGHWEGNTLVVSVRNNNSKWRFGRTGEFVTDQATVEERFTFDNNGQRFTYDATYTDPGAMTRPFTITVPNKRVTVDTPVDGWNNMTVPVRYASASARNKPDIEAYERICTENNGPHGTVALTNAR